MLIGSPRNLTSKIGDKPVLVNNAPVPVGGNTAETLFIA